MRTEHNKRTLARYYERKKDPMFLLERNARARARHKANPEVRREQARQHVDRLAKRIGLEEQRKRAAEKRKRCLDVQRKSCPEHLQRQYFERNLKTKFKMTTEEYAFMELSQDYKCASCGEPFTGENYAVIDHCHTTGKVRALLHNKCNAALGMLLDDPIKLRKLLNYIESHQ